jgi:hypothetical protein
MPFYDFIVTLLKCHFSKKLNTGIFNKVKSPKSDKIKSKRCNASLLGEFVFIKALIHKEEKNLHDIVNYFLETSEIKMNMYDFKIKILKVILEMLSYREWSNTKFR